MIRGLSVLLGLWLSLAACATPPPAEETVDRIEVVGDIARPSSFDRAALEALGAIDGTWIHREQEHSFRGVPLDLVLEACGFTRGAMGPEVPKREKVPEWKLVLLATAADGFQAAYSCAELMPSMGPTRAFVVWDMDGAPLPPDRGPFRILVTTDREGSRSPYAARRLELIDLARL